MLSGPRGVVLTGSWRTRLIREMLSPKFAVRIVRAARCCGAVQICGFFLLLRFGADLAVASEVPPALPTVIAAVDRSVGHDRTIDALGLDLVWIKPGTFLMGSPLGEAGRDKAEGPQTRVTLSKGFWLGRTHVTQSQYEAVMGTNPSYFKSSGRDAPVEEVSWLDATEFCVKLTDRERGAGRLPEGYAFTLPTEAQWEYARRAGKTEEYGGNPDTMAWHEGNSGGSTHSVGLKEANAWGLRDMSGNVLQWCSDWYGDYPGGAVTDPTGPETGYFRMARGGSWRMRVEVCRSAARAGGSAGRRDYTLGFRLALTPRVPSPSRNGSRPSLN